VTVLAAVGSHGYRGFFETVTRGGPGSEADMTTQGIVTMILVLLFVWGGFALFVAAAVRKEREKKGGDA
jgi:hypothetical protein